MSITNKLIEDFRKYWQNTIDLNPDAGVITTLRDFLGDRKEILTENEIEILSFEILTTKKGETE